MSITSSKERIRNRLLKNASQMWGVQSSDLSAMDPLVNMLFGACAAEIEKVYNELESSHARVLERLSKLLLPEINNGPTPAHAIIHGRSYEASSILSKNSQLYFRKRVPSTESSVREDYHDIYFNPLFDTKIFDGDIKLMAFGAGVFELTEVVHKEKLFDFATANYRAEKSSLWIGIEVSDKLNSLNGMSLYFDWPTSGEKENYIKFLPFSKLSTNQYEIEYNTGFGMQQDENLEDKIEFDYSKNTEREIAAYYENRMLTLKSVKGFRGDLRTLKAKYPEEFKLYLQPKQLEKFEQELLWVKIVFPSFITTDVIDEMICSINSFPACNKKFNDFSYRLQPNFNIIPLNAERDFYYSIQSVKSGDGVNYTTTKLADIHKIGPGTFVVRKGGVERFDRRNATAFLSYLTELLRDESAGFQVFGQEMIANNIKELDQQLTILTQKIEKNPESGEPVTYLIVKPKTASENVFIEYWSTSGSFANNIRLGSTISIASANELNSEDLLLLSNTLGGRDSLSSHETLDSFKYSLMTRDRVVTISDIKHICKKELGGIIADVQITKGLEVDDKSFSGFIRTIDAVLIPTDKNTPTKDEWQSLCRSLQIKIQSHASFYMPVRVKVR